MHGSTWVEIPLILKHCAVIIQRHQEKGVQEPDMTKLINIKTMKSL